MSVQSSLDPYGSNTTLASTASSDMDSGRKSSGADAGDQAHGSPQQKSIHDLPNYCFYILIL